MAQTNDRNDMQSDSFDRGIIPAETKARIEREGGSYKETPASESESGIDTTGGYTTSNEGLVNNYAVEPEMYYEERGDLREKEEALKQARAEELKRVSK